MSFISRVNDIKQNAILHLRETTTTREGMLMYIYIYIYIAHKTATNHIKINEWKHGTSFIQVTQRKSKTMTRTNNEIVTTMRPTATNHQLHWSTKCTHIQLTITNHERE